MAARKRQGSRDKFGRKAPSRKKATSRKATKAKKTYTMPYKANPFTPGTKEFLEESRAQGSTERVRRGMSGRASKGYKKR